MPCNASYARFILEGFSYAWQIDMQPICTPMLAKFYFCKKVGVTERDKLRVAIAYNKRVKEKSFQVRDLV
jgi:hypothetical protein